MKKFQNKKFWINQKFKNKIKLKKLERIFKSYKITEIAKMIQV